MTAYNIVPNMVQEETVLKNHQMIKSQLEKKIEEGQREKKIPSFLLYRREEFTKKLEKLEMDRLIIQDILNEGIPAPDINLFIETSTHRKIHQPLPESSINLEQLDENLKEVNQPKQQKGKMITRQITIGKERNIEAEKAKAKEESYRLTQALLEERDKEIMQRTSIKLGIIKP